MSNALVDKYIKHPRYQDVFALTRITPRTDANSKQVTFPIFNWAHRNTYGVLYYVAERYGNDVEPFWTLVLWMDDMFIRGEFYRFFHTIMDKEQADAEALWQ